MKGFSGRLTQGRSRMNSVVPAPRKICSGDKPSLSAIFSRRAFPEEGWRRERETFVFKKSARPGGGPQGFKRLEKSRRSSGRQPATWAAFSRSPPCSKRASASDGIRFFLPRFFPKDRCRDIGGPCRPGGHIPLPWSGDLFSKPPPCGGPIPPGSLPATSHSQTSH